MKLTPALLFIHSAAFILLVTAGAKLYSASADSRMFETIEPILRLKYRDIMMVVGIVEIAVSVYLLRAKAVRPRAFAILWLASNFLLYRTAAKYLEVEICPCLGTFAPNLPLKMGQVDHLLAAVVFYFLAGSIWILYSVSREGEATEPILESLASP
jgi:hypothetical protein